MLQKWEMYKYKSLAEVISKLVSISRPRFVKISVQRCFHTQSSDLLPQYSALCFTLDHISLHLLTNPRGQDFITLALHHQDSPKRTKWLHSAALYLFTSSTWGMQRGSGGGKNWPHLGRDRRGRQQWPGAVGRNHPWGVYIWGLGHGYGAPVYGNAGSLDQSAGKLQKYHHRLPVNQASPRRSLISL